MTVVGPCEGYFGLVGPSAALGAVTRLLERVRGTTLPVLIEGATGTGKDLVAGLLHARGPRAGGPFVALHGGSVAAGLVDSVLFGHRRGAFTGAVEDRVGVFEAAHGGTLYLDDLGALPGEVQVRLLRVLEDGWVWPVGAGVGRRVEVRVVASIRGPEDEGMVRGDLLQRLAGVRVRLPALEARREDIPALVACFEARHGDGRRLSADAVAWLSGASWPGNVRQLEAVVRAALVLGEGREVGRAEVEALHGGAEGAAGARSDGAPVVCTGPEQGSAGRGLRGAWEGFAGEQGPGRGGQAGAVRTLAEAEREAIVQAMMALGGNKKRVAEALGIDRSTLYAKLRLHGLGGG